MFAELWKNCKVTHIIHDKATESVLNSRITSRGQREQLTTITGALSKEEGLTDAFTKAGGSIQNTERPVYILTGLQGQEHHTTDILRFTRSITRKKKKKTPFQLCNCVNCNINQSPEFWQVTKKRVIT